MKYVLLATVILVPSAGLLLGTRTAARASDERLDNGADSQSMDPELMDAHDDLHLVAVGPGSTRPHVKNVSDSKGWNQEPAEHAALAREPDIGDHVEDAADTVIDAMTPPFVKEAMDKGLDVMDVYGDDLLPGSQHKPLMDAINVLRTELCWQRPNLMEHKPCMEFLGLHCEKESTGEGFCKKFTKKLGNECKKEVDPKTKKYVCKFYKRLRDSYLTPEEQKEHEEQKEQEEAPGQDSDGDQIPDDQDEFPNDPDESKDTDNDTIPDHADSDIDGDKVNNDEDAFPLDAKHSKDTDKDLIPDEEDADKDGDGLKNEEDAFETNPKEWRDTDGDGIGDNEDAYPLNKHCHDGSKPCKDVENDPPKPPPESDPSQLDKKNKALPSQGYNEVHPSNKVKHTHHWTWTGDWQNEFEHESLAPSDAEMNIICQQYPDNEYCQQYLHKDFNPLKREWPGE